jgi:hypothetical protein
MPGRKNGEKAYRIGALKIGEKQLFFLNHRNFSSIRQVLFLPRGTGHETHYNIKRLLKLDIQSDF